MSISERDIALLHTDTLLVEAEAEWVDAMNAATALPPLTGDALTEAEALLDEYLTGEETRQIARIVFQLKTAQIDDVTKMKALIERHNVALSEDLADADYSKRSGLTKQRLSGALMDTPAKQELMLIAVERHGAGALHKTGFCKLLTRLFNHNRVGFALDALATAGFMARHMGASNSEFYVSDGRLEEIYKSYLTRIAEGGTP